MIILGLNTFFEHPAVAIVRDGALTFALEDERLTRIKHGKRYTPFRTYVPYDAIHAALTHEGLSAGDLDEIACSYNRWDHLRSLWGCFTGHRASSFSDELSAFGTLTHLGAALREGYELPSRYRRRMPPAALARVPRREWNHHLSHAASAFFCSGFREALVIVSDGSGEVACTSIYVGRDARLTRVARMSLPHSLGLFYSAITAHLGFEPFADEYKVMGLAAYGEPAFAAEMADLVRLMPRGRYQVHAAVMRHLETALGPRRAPDEPLDARHRDIAKSAQARLEAAVAHIATHFLRETGLDRLCLAGGTFLNCVANQHLSRLGLAREIFVQPAAHDAGTAVGAAALSWVRRGGAPQLAWPSMFLGQAHGNEAIAAALDQARARYVRVEGREAIERVARLLAGERIVALYRGRLEFGPRALGNRSLLASPRSVRAREKLNTLKDREQFRPLAPIVTAEAFDEFFEGPRNRYMMFTVTARPAARERAPAIVHADGTARAQVVAREDDGFLHALLERVGELTGVPILINSSLNVRGKPIDESPQDALASFYTSGIDCLLAGDFLVERELDGAAEDIGQGAAEARTEARVDVRTEARLDA